MPTNGLKPDVLVAGAGPVGLFSALTLARSGVAVRVVDTGIWACRRSYALGLHADTLELLESCGLREMVLENSSPVRRLAFRDSTDRRLTVETGEMRIVRQDTLEAILEAALAGHGVRVDWRHELADLAPRHDGLEVTLHRFEKESRGYSVAHTEWVVAGKQRFEVAFLLGADGHNSRVRRSLGLEFPQVAPAQYAAVFEFDTDARLGDEASIVFGERTTDMLWPLGGGRCRWSFQLPDYHDLEAEALQDRLQAGGFGYFPFERPKDREDAPLPGQPAALDEAMLPRLIAERAPWFTGSIGNIHWRTMVRFERRLATPFGRGQAWLAGDAAHLTAPAGMQSMNLGMLEGLEYAYSIEAILRGKSKADALEAAGARWNTEWRRLLGLDVALQPAAGCDPWLAAHRERILACLPAHGDALNRMVAQLGLELSLSAAR